MTTYKSFLIHDNLRCYLDVNGRRDPMFVTTEFNSLDELKTRIDKYWEEWQQFESKRKVDIAKSFQVLKDDIDRSDEAREIDDQRFEDRMNQHYEKEHWFGE